jgi:hypothetical protein
MLIYAQLLQRWNLTMQEMAYDKTVTEEEYEVKFREYQGKLQKLYNRLKSEYGMSEDEFRDLKDQAMTM